MAEFVLRNMTPERLSDYVSRQLAVFFPDGHSVPPEGLHSHIGNALERIRLCFIGIEKNKFRDGGQVMFNYQHPDHYAMFLYLLANTVSRHDHDNPLAFRLYYLNKILHSLDAFPDISLPEVFQFMHPAGTVLGHARYGNYFCVYQGCTVGSGEDGVYPEIGDYVVLYAKASVIGRSRIGNNVVIGTSAAVINKSIPDNKVVLGAIDNLNVRDSSRHVLERRFR